MRRGEIFWLGRIRCVLSDSRFTDIRPAGAYKSPLGDSRVHDHQDVAGPVTNLGQTAELSTAVWDTAGLPIGYLTLETTGDVTAVDLRLSLWTPN